MAGHIASKRQLKKKNKGKTRKARVSLKLRKKKAPEEPRVKRGKSKAFDEVLSTGRVSGRSNSFLKSSGGGSGSGPRKGGGAKPAEDGKEVDKWSPANPVLTAQFPRPMPLSMLPIVAVRRANANRITQQNRGE